MIKYDESAVQYLAKLSEGGLRDAITLMDKCLSYSTDLTIENVVKALGIANYDIMFSLLDGLIEHKAQFVLEQIDSIYSSGIDMKQFIKSFTEFVLDICKYGLAKDFSMIRIPNIYEGELKQFGDYEFFVSAELLKMLISLNNEIKWESNPKYPIEARFFIFSISEVENDSAV